MTVDQEIMTPHEAGKFLQRRRQELGYKAEQVLDNTTIPSKNYLSYLENGKVNPARSKHLPSLAQFLRLTEDEVRQINPNLVVTLSSQPILLQPEKVELPEGLQKLIEDMGSKWPELQDPELQQALAQMRRRGRGPESADDWFSFYAAVRVHFIEKKR